MTAHRTLIATASLCLIACGGDDDEASDETTTTEEETTTTTEPPAYEGIVYDGGTEPTFSAHGVTSRIDAIVVVELTDPEVEDTRFVDECASQVEQRPEATSATSCVVIQWSFDVAADFRVDENSPDAHLIPGAFVGADRIQHDQGSAAVGVPCTVANVMSAAYPLTAGNSAGTLRFVTGSNFVGNTTHTFEVPGNLPPLEL